MSDFSIELCNFCDDQAYSKALSVLTRHEPRQIFFLPSAVDSVLEKIATSEFPLARISRIPRTSSSQARMDTPARPTTHSVADTPSPVQVATLNS